MTAPARSHRRAFRSLLSGVLAFCASQALLAAYIEWFALDIRDPVYEPRIATFKRRCACANDALTVVVLGASRTQRGLQGAEIEQRLMRSLGRRVVVCNLSREGGGLVTSLLFVQRLLADGMRPDLIVIETVPALMAGQVPMLDMTAAALPQHSLRRDDWPLVARYVRTEQSLSINDARCARLFPIYYDRLELVTAMSPALLPRYTTRRHPYDIYGGVGVRSTRPSPGGLAEQRRTFAPYFRDYRLGDRQQKALQETLAKCRAVGVPAALLLTPEGPEFQRWYRPGDRSRVLHFLAQRSASEDVPLIDASDWLAENDFVDSHHMHSGGARKFSRRLAEKIAPLLQDSKLARGPNGTRQARTFPR
jgi:hypothetical protein